MIISVVLVLYAVMDIIPIFIGVSNNNNNNVSLLQLQTNAAKDTHNICQAGLYAHTVQHGNVSSHTWTTAMDYSHTGGGRFTQCH